MTCREPTETLASNHVCDRGPAPLLQPTANVALGLLYETRDSPDQTECKQYEIYRANTTAFSSLTKREFHASHSEEADGHFAVAVQSEKNFSHPCQGRQAWK